MPANLPHLYFESLRREVTVPLLDLVDAVVEGLPAGAGPVGIVATRPIRDAGLYQRALADRGMTALAADSTQVAIDNLLGALWAGRPQVDLGARWTRLLRDVAGLGAESVLLACTDFNAIEAREPNPLPVLDATRLMARKVVSTWLALTAPRGRSPA